MHVGQAHQPPTLQNTNISSEGLDGKIIPLSQGKLLGGSSAINGQAFVANSKAAMDAWAEFGSPGWDWQSMAPYFKKFHTLSRPSPAASEHLRLDYINDALGWPASGDPFSGEFVGGYINAMSIDPEPRTRSDAATAYYEPAKARSNLHVVTGTVAEKIIFDTSGKVPKAVGVQVQKGGKTTTVEAGKEVILAAGTVGTPKLLELSGVGDQTLLESLGIPVVVHNPNVGENL
ncbi:Oxygen-dependent choline dehydrogenase [Cytospora mali]|uniref:Oxygen-dependent choline dehydrogenase n=1 Tax=Cytospora mali TaxID=578113 RepID=A0A194V099_CYTMA|nr:Oxygen-dependent choline dehydrogenase [Valsa mali var. pyri (nom. inval.)]